MYTLKAKIARIDADLADYIHMLLNPHHSRV